MFRLKVDEEIEIRMFDESEAETVFALVDRNREYLRQWLIWVDRSDSPEVTRQFIKDSKRLYENKEAMSAGIWLNGELVGATGIVSFVTAPANGVALTWTGAYYYRCRFKQDLAEFSKFMKDLWELKKLELRSVKI